jgi:hypothetical protein
MKFLAHQPTLRGLGPDDDQVDDDDIVEVDGEPPPPSGGRYAMVTVPPSRPSGATNSGAYRLFPPRSRRATLRGNGDA